MFFFSRSGPTCSNKLFDYPIPRTYHQLCLSRICWDWSNSFDLKKFDLWGVKRLSLWVYMPQYLVSWEPEGRYCRSKMFRWEPEGRHCHWLCTAIAYGTYCHWLCTAIAPFWFSTEHLWAAITPFWLSTDDVVFIQVLPFRFHLRLDKIEVHQNCFKTIPMIKNVRCSFTFVKGGMQCVIFLLHIFQRNSH